MCAKVVTFGRRTWRSCEEGVYKKERHLDRLPIGVGLELHAVTGPGASRSSWRWNEEGERLDRFGRLGLVWSYMR